LTEEISQTHFQGFPLFFRHAQRGKNSVLNLNFPIRSGKIDRRCVVVSSSSYFFAVLEEPHQPSREGISTPKRHGPVPRRATVGHRHQTRRIFQSVEHQTTKIRHVTELQEIGSHPREILSPPHHLLQSLGETPFLTFHEGFRRLTLSGRQHGRGVCHQAHENSPGSTKGHQSLPEPTPFVLSQPEIPVVSHHHHVRKGFQSPPHRHVLCSLQGPPVVHHGGATRGIQHGPGAVTETFFRGLVVIEEKRFRAFLKRRVQMIDGVLTLTKKIQNAKTKICPKRFQHQGIHVSVSHKTHPERSLFGKRRMPCHRRCHDTVEIGMADDVKRFLVHRRSTILSSPV